MPERANQQPVVVKIGGGLLRAADTRTLRQLGEELERAAHARPLAIVPGGGPFADAVRGVDRAIGLSDEAADRMAVLAMEQFGHLLLDLMPAAVPTTELAPTRWRRERPALLLPAVPLAGPTPLPASWAVTSDSIAAWFAAEAGARLLLLKPVPGLLPTWPGTDPPLPAIDADALEALQAAGGGAVVDRWFPTALRQFGIDAAIADGRDSTIGQVIAGQSEPGTWVLARRISELEGHQTPTTSGRCVPPNSLVV